MIRTILFLWALVPTLLALLAAPAFAAPTVTQIGNARVTVSVSPDPPVVGTNTVTVQIAGASTSAIANTTVRYSTLMPSMNMAGPSGTAVRETGRGDTWRFSANLGMAAEWKLSVQLSGAVSGSVNTDVNVGQAMNSMPGMTAGSSSGSMSGMDMSGMNMSGDTSAPWRNAIIALIVVMLIGAIVYLRNRRPLTLVLAGVAGLVVIVLAFTQFRYAAPAMDMSTMSSIGGNAPVPVTLATVQSGSNGRAVHAPANIEPFLVQNIVARAPGVLTGFTAYNGDKVHAGEVIARLNEPELQSNAEAALAAARAAQIEAMHHAPNGVVIAGNDLRAAQSEAAAAHADVGAKAQQVAYWKDELQREKLLLGEGAVSQREYEDETAQAAAAQSAYDAARERAVSAGAQVASAQTRTGDAQANVEMAAAQAAQANAAAQAQSVMAGYTNVIVPDDAVVMKRLVDPGVYVQSGTPILQIATIDRLRVQVQLAEEDLQGIDTGAKVDVRFDNGMTLHGHISSVSPVADASSHTAIAEAIVDNPGNRLQPGGFARAIVYASNDARRDALVVPSASVIGGATTAVWTESNGTAHRVPVTVLGDDGTTAQIQGDLRSGMRVVVSGAQGLEEGQSIAEGAQ